MYAAVMGNDCMKRPSRSTLVILIVAVLSVSAICGFIYSKNGNSLDLSDTHVRIVITGSMDGEPRNQYDIPSVPVGSLIFISEVPDDEAGRNAFYSSLKIGDVVTFDYTHPVSGDWMVVTHRIVDIVSVDGHYTFTMQGDTPADDPTNNSVQIVTSDSGDMIGKVTGVSPLLGQIMTFISTFEGKTILILIPCSILIAFEVRNIYRNLRKKEETG